MKTLGKYQILAEIGKGGFATVFRARDMTLDRDVALKVLDPLLMRDPEWVRHFHKEARAIAKFRHPRIVTIFDIGQVEGSLFIAMELIEGGSLADRLKREGALPWEAVVDLISQMAEALDYAHSKGVLHRDLKPGNVLLDPETGSVLTDFGFARILSDNSLTVTMSGGVVGTPEYIAPEVWDDEAIGPGVDIYAMGCILYELVTGQVLFTGQSVPAVMRAHFKPRRFPETWPEDVPPDLTEVLETALAIEPAERYATAGELAQAVRDLSVDTLAEPYFALEEAVAACQWQAALELADAIKAENPDYRDVTALAQRALAGMQEEARAQQVAAWKEEAEQALAEGDLAGAELALKQWLKLLPDDEQALAMQAQVDELQGGSDASGGSRVAGGASGDAVGTGDPEPDSRSSGFPASFLINWREDDELERQKNKRFFGTTNFNETIMKDAGVIALGWAISWIVAISLLGLYEFTYYEYYDGGTYLFLFVAAVSFIMAITIGSSITIYVLRKYIKISGIQEFVIIIVLLFSPFIPSALLFIVNTILDKLSFVVPEVLMAIVFGILFAVWGLIGGGGIVAVLKIQVEGFSKRQVWTILGAWAVASILLYISLGVTLFVNITNDMEAIIILSIAGAIGFSAWGGIGGYTTLRQIYSILIKETKHTAMNTSKS